VYPSLYQINTRIWLNELTARLGRPVDLASIPDSELDALVEMGFDWVWLLGIWQTGDAGKQVSRSQVGWQRDYRHALTDFRIEDVVGSPFAIQQYVVHRDFGGPAALARLRQKLKDRGIRLLLDFVPNHTALDNPWVSSHPEYYVGGSQEDLAREPQNYIRLATGVHKQILAHGRDPYFPGWPDTLQLNYFHAGFRAAMKEVLLTVARQCDGVRCDMAMLLLPDVFRRTWGERARPTDNTLPVESSFWSETIAEIHRAEPDFMLMAEVYWDLEWNLQQEGFDYTYDKRLYDRLHGRDAEGCRAHLRADLGFQNKLVRFLENHDEPRAAATLAPEMHLAAALTTYLAPGLRFFFEGQLDGRRIRTNIHLSRREPEPVDAQLHKLYEQLLELLKRHEVRAGAWRLLDVREAWPGNATARQYLAYSWELEERRLVAVVNLGPGKAQGKVTLPWTGIASKQFRFADLLSGQSYDWRGADLAADGLFVERPAWGCHVFEMTMID
jgi:glycosidase